MLSRVSRTPRPAAVAPALGLCGLLACGCFDFAGIAPSDLGDMSGGAPDLAAVDAAAPGLDQSGALDLAPSVPDLPAPGDDLASPPIVFVASGADNAPSQLVDHVDLFIPGSSQAGDLVLAIVFARAANGVLPTVTAPDGWLEQCHGSRPGDFAAYTYAHVATGPAGSASFTLAPASYAVVGFMVFRGASRITGATCDWVTAMPFPGTQFTEPTNPTAKETRMAIAFFTLDALASDHVTWASAPVDAVSPLVGQTVLIAPRVLPMGGSTGAFTATTNASSDKLAATAVISIAP